MRLPFRYQALRFMASNSTTTQPRYVYPRLDEIEDLENYRSGGFHPVSIGDVFAQGRYKVLHKLGFGGASTVWLARDQRPPEDSRGSLVTLKVMSAEQSSRPMTDIPDLHIPQQLQKFTRHPGRENILVVKDHFSHEGPNGRHLCIVSQFAGPSVFSLYECPGRISGSRRLRGDLARKVAKQVSNAVGLLHSAGVVHGDLTTSNILFRVSDAVHNWSDDDVYRVLGTPEVDDVITKDGSPPGPVAPSAVVAPINISSTLPLQENTFLIDFGQSFFIQRPPPGYEPATPLPYLAPEAFFESKVSFPSDIWALACIIFEIRTGAPLFDNFLNSDTIILKQLVETLGRFPEPWWNSWEERLKWFDETGEPLSQEEQRKKGAMLTANKTSVRQHLREVGEQDEAPEGDEGDMIERTGTKLDEAEVELLGDLLDKMLKHQPEGRITISEVVQHPWFGYK